MCFNPEVSILAYLVGITGCLELWSRNYVPEALFYAWVIQMQLIEFFIWKNQPCSAPQVNYTNTIISKTGLIVNHLEPIIFWLAILKFSDQTLPFWVQAAMCGYVLVSIMYSYNVWTDTQCTEVTEQSKPHLHWKWNNGKYSEWYYGYFLAVLVLLSIYGLPKNRGIKNAFVGVTGFLFSIAIYREKHSVGAMWCFSAAFAPWLLSYIY